MIQVASHHQRAAAAAAAPCVLIDPD